MSYDPKPTDTSGVRLPSYLRSLIEKLAENNHDLWARKRFAEGWSYAPQRDTREKTHPDLVPYSDLPESEKDYDRISVTETLKAVSSLKYRILPPENTSDPGLPDRELEKLQVRKPGKASFSELLRIWSVVSSGHWTGSARVYVQLSEHFLNAGEPFVSYDVVSKGLETWPKHLRLRQLLGLSLARSGAFESANRILGELYSEGKRDGETLGILARTHKDMAALSSTGSDRFEQLRTALGFYMEGYRRVTQNRKRVRLDDALYNGINAASMSLLLGMKEAAKSLAREVLEICRRKLKRKKTDYWALAALGEAALILGEMSTAEEYYGLAAEAANGNYGILSTTRRQARLLLEYMNLDQERFDHCLHIPGIVIFISPRVEEPSFGASSATMKRVGKEIAERLQKLDAGFGYGSAAPGPEILFMEEVLRRKGEAHVVLPFEKEAFFRSYVDAGEDAAWSRRFQRVTTRATRLMIACDQCKKGTPMAFDFAGLLHLGLAKLHAQVLETPITPLLVQPGLSDDDLRLEESWQSHGLGRPEVIDVREPEKRTDISPADYEPPGNEASASPELEQSIKIMLFGDVVGYSHMAEESIPHFVNRFMGLISEVVENSAEKPLTGNTWGDAVYFVFADVEGAAEFALTLRDRIQSAPWQDFGLPNLNLRISLHAGPVFHCEDPVVKRLKYTGSHVSRAARIEPITPPGEIYASQEFAAVAAAKGVRDFRCDYVGKIPLPKQSGTISLYVVRRGRDGKNE